MPGARLLFFGAAIDIQVSESSLILKKKWHLEGRWMGLVVGHFFEYLEEAGGTDDLTQVP